MSTSISTRTTIRLCSLTHNQIKPNEKCAQIVKNKPHLSVFVSQNFETYIAFSKLGAQEKTTFLVDVSSSPRVRTLVYDRDVRPEHRYIRLKSNALYCVERTLQFRPFFGVKLEKILSLLQFLL